VWLWLKRRQRAETRRLRPRGALALELQLHQFVVLVGHFEHGARFQAHEGGHKHLGDLADACVVGVDVAVEELAPVGDALFQFADARLQLRFSPR
jgi:hypothetical protein